MSKIRANTGISEDDMLSKIFYAVDNAIQGKFVN